jgi:hypothetical protein
MPLAEPLERLINYQSLVRRVVDVFGATLFVDILARVAGVEDPRDIPNQNLQQVVDSSMKACLRGMQSIREFASEFPETEFYMILDELEIRSLDRIMSFEFFLKLGKAMKEASGKTAA